MRFRNRFTLPAVLALLAAGCLNPGDNDRFQRDELRRARDQWVGEQVTSYSYEIAVQCICEGVFDDPVRVTVEDGDPTSVVYVESGTAAPAAAFAPYDTVEELFDLIEDAIDRDADILQVGYDPELGFPTVINIDYDAATNNDHLLVVIGDFDVTPAS